MIMLTMLGRPTVTCGGVSRRNLLQAGGAGLLGLNLSKLLNAEAQQPFANGRAKSVMFLFLFGGPSQLETFDLKPKAPSKIRGPFRPIASRTPEVLCELRSSITTTSPARSVGGGHFRRLGGGG